MNEAFQVINGDSREVLKAMEDHTFSAIVTDPPYGLTSIQKRFGKNGSKEAKHGKDGSFNRLSKGFMGQTWDGQGIEKDPAFWAECLRVAKPGAYLLAFGGTRTAHRIACAIEDAGWEIRDSILSWAYGSGFPKCHVWEEPTEADAARNARLAEEDRRMIEAGFEGWANGGLKPSQEPIIMARAPISEGSVAANVLRWGTGAINVAGCRVESGNDYHDLDVTQGVNTARTSWEHWQQPRKFEPSEGRFPPNLCLVHHPLCERLGSRPTSGARRDETTPNGHTGTRLQNSTEKHQFNYAGEATEEWRCYEGCVVAELGRQSGDAGGGFGVRGASSRIYGGGKGYTEATGEIVSYGDEGTAARFYPQFAYEPEDFVPFLYCPKPSKAEREAGLERLKSQTRNRVNPGGMESDPRWGPVQAKNVHPTCKPASLMQWLIRLVCPPDGVILDPFCGSGSTGVAAMREGKRIVLIERDTEQGYVEIATARIREAQSRGRQLSLLEGAAQ